VFDVFATVAVKAWVCPELSDTLPGLTDTVTGGTSVTAAVAETAELAALVAVTVTVCGLMIEDGAV
jgi:hypothetical protein